MILLVTRLFLVTQIRRKSLDSQQRNSLPTLYQKHSSQLDGEIIQKTLSKITGSYQKFQGQSFIQRLGEILKGILEKFIDNFWVQPAWLVASVSAVLFNL